MFFFYEYKYESDKGSVHYLTFKLYVYAIVC